MNSKELQEMYECKCFLLTRENIGTFPKCPAVYVIFWDKVLNHPVGGSDILYLGKADDDVRIRWSGYYNPGPSQETNKRINRFLRVKGKKYVLIISVDTKKEARDLENMLLKKFEGDHFTHPPLNRG